MKQQNSRYISLSPPPQPYPHPRPTAQVFPEYLESVSRCTLSGPRPRCKVFGSLTMSRSRVTLAMMLAAAMQNSRPSPPMTHAESTSARPGGVKLPSTSTNGFGPELSSPFRLFVFSVLALEALEQTSRAQLYMGVGEAAGRGGGSVVFRIGLIRYVNLELCTAAMGRSPADSHRYLGMSVVPGRCFANYKQTEGVEPSQNCS